ncbi:hypothetical protein JHW43_006247 [Diplocarpon mali]|nr:hypothetical protein JHW43_006247 [Diplocarpon mali]
MTAIFNFQSALLVFLLFICTSAYCHQLFPQFMDRKKDSYVLHKYLYIFWLRFGSNIIAADHGLGFSGINKFYNMAMSSWYKVRLFIGT